ncbi:hypothetical protein ACFFIC_03265 [Roseomonas vinacea]|uniref:Uncharacterized protein n=1 Tax=Muricoccus vinaceus TaxID=424704 RepID=A0ABV6IPI6_9PROT
MVFIGGPESEPQVIGASAVLALGRSYTVGWIELGACESSVFLVEHPRMPFNTLLFRHAEEDGAAGDGETVPARPGNVVAVEFRQGRLRLCGGFPA